MKTVEDLRRYYDNVLLDDLRALEKERRKLVKRVILLIVSVFIVLGLSLVLMPYFHLCFGFIFFPIGVIALLLVIVYGVRLMTSDYVGDFKARVIGGIVRFIDEDLVYARNKHIPLAAFMESRLFQGTPNRYRGDDYVSGVIGETRVDFSEVHAEYRVNTVDGSGRPKTNWYTLFKGLFFIADFNKDFRGRTVVLPDTAEKLFGSVLGSTLQSWNRSRGELVKLEDPEFEKYFVVYGSSQIESRYILSTSLMKRILDFRKKTNRDVFISFVGSKIFVAIQYPKDLFEPNLFMTTLDFNQAREYFEDLRLAVDIVEDLNLNTRIWSKQ